jgi:hypothetical protein
MILNLSGSRFVIGGTFNRPLSKRVLRERLVAAGATVGTTVTTQTTAVILGETEWMTDLEGRARRLGLPILDEAQALELLANGSITLAEDAAPDAPLDALIGEARSLLDGEPSARTWDAIVALLDRCAPAHERALVDYLEPALDRWRVPRDARYDFKGASSDFRGRNWAMGCPSGYLRVFPLHWITAALQDGNHERFRLARALVLPRTELSNANVERLLGLDTLAHVTYLDLRGYGPKPSGRVLAALARAPMFANLEELRLQAFENTHARALDLGSPERLRHLRLDLRAGAMDDAAVDALTRSSWVAGLTEFTHDLYGYSVLVGAPDLRPIEGLERVTLWNNNWLDLYLDYVDTTPRAGTLALAGEVSSVDPARTRELLRLPVDLAPCLDLSSLRVSSSGMTDGNWRNRSMNAVFLKHLPGSAFGASFESIRLGHWFTPARAEALTAHGLTVLDLEDDT